jgi:protein Tex
MDRIFAKLTEELAVDPSQVVSAVKLLDEGATVPFIARYRKEATRGLTDTQLRQLEERLRYLRDLEERRAVVLRTIQEQGNLTPELEAEINAAETRVRLEDLYTPFRPKRRTRAQTAREAGLEPLALALLADPSLVPEEAAVPYVDAEKGLPDASAALEGARHILMENFAEDAALIGELREFLWENAVLSSRPIEGKEEAGAKFADYFQFEETIKTIPSHRALALFRGRRESILKLGLKLAPEGAEPALIPEARVAAQFHIEDAGRPGDSWLLETAAFAWRARIYPRLEAELENRLKERAEEEAIRVFGRNLHDLLLAPPAGPQVIMGLDPGYRTGVKAAVVDATGKLLETATIYPHEPQKKWDESLSALADLATRHQVRLVGIGNGTASRETDRLVTELMRAHPDLGLSKLVISEAGASVYSASDLASKEFPDLDVSLRGAVSIARRLQDPLAELVKIEPRSIGVGQYQHDVAQGNLMRALDAVVEDCVNAVGVDVNTASIPLLSRVSGLNRRLAKTIVAYRDHNGAFKSREQLRLVPQMGEKTFEQSAGFLRIMDGDNPLDASSVHPEAYPVVQKIVEATGKEVKQLIGDAILRQINPVEYVDERFGEPTVRDILVELEKPGRDPRPEFKTAEFREGVNEIEDLQPGMVLEGIVSNVANFGAFVDIGVHQDGLVHISQLAGRFVKDPREVVKTGQIVKVKVLEVNLERRRISLSMRIQPPRPVREPRPRTYGPPQTSPVGQDAEGSQVRTEDARRQRPPRRQPDKRQEPGEQDPQGQRPGRHPDRRREAGHEQDQRHNRRQDRRQGKDQDREKRPEKKQEKPEPARPQTAMAAAFAKLKWEQRKS